MPLVRVQVRNEYGLGQPELYREPNREDPKAVLDGVAVAGLVGILRQLGDLAEFAAKVFHGLQEQVMGTSSRSHKLMVRVKHIEAALPPLEKVILAQKSHLHFAYTAGSDWHAHLQSEQNHFIYDELPQFIMDSYEECRDPPRLHLLDKFDTGGPGSCLKRYSDRTFFRRAAAKSGEANVDKVSKDRKACRSKKKRTWQRNEVSHAASISNHSNRTQFASLKVDEQISPRTVSTYYGTLKSDIGDQSNSFDARTGSGHIECVPRLTYSMKPEEHEPKESSFSSSRMYQNVDSAFIDEHNRAVDDAIPCNLLQEQTGPSLTCVTWDEKTEIVESTGYQFDHDETVEILTMNFDGDSQEKGAVNFRNVDQMHLQFDNEGTPTLISGQNQLVDIESGPDNYMDALYIIESESETETVLDCQTKQDVERFSNFSDDRTQYGMHGLSAHDSDLQPSNWESQTAVYSSSTKETSFDKPNSISLESFAHEESGQMAGESSNIGNSLGLDFCGNNNILNGSNVESDVLNLPYSGSAESNPQAPVNDKIISTFGKSMKSPIEPSVVESINFWTNGSLLGLEPSKPPDFGVLNAVSQEPETRSKDDTTNPLSHSLNGDGDVGKLDKLVQSSKSIEQSSAKCSTSCHNYRDDKKTSWRFLPTDLDAKHEKYGDSDPSNSFNDNRGHSLSETSAVIPGTEQAVPPGIKAISTEATQRDGENASQMFGLDNRFLVNGFQRNISLTHDEKSETPSSRKTDIFEQKSQNRTVSYQTFSERTFKGYFGSGSPLYSPSSSPPLQHMKISFQPVNGFETSKLKLIFPDGSYCHNSSRDMLPSFQLVPDPATPQYDIGSDSDNDTFCRSSPYMSDDCVSHHYESNSEQWESDCTPPSKDNELYQALCKISSTDSVSSSLDLEGTGRGSIDVDYGLQSPYVEHCLELCPSGCPRYLPSLSTLNPLFEQEIKFGSDAKDLPESHFAKGPTPQPPPLPPLQWRILKPLSDVTIGKLDSVSEALNHAFDIKILGSTISPQSKPSPIKQQQITDEASAFTTKSKQPDFQKLNGQKEVNRAIKGGSVDEKEDFLHQIRTKSFSLRRTLTEKPTVTPGPSSNVKVTPILKANAMRLVVGSDDREDDKWSDI